LKENGGKGGGNKNVAFGQSNKNKIELYSNFCDWIQTQFPITRK